MCQHHLLDGFARLATIWLHNFSLLSEFTRPRAELLAHGAMLLTQQVLCSAIEW